MTRKHVALQALLHDLPAETFLGSCWPERHVVAHGAVERLPELLRTGPLADPRALSAAYRGPVEVTSGGKGQYRVDGQEARVFFEELGLTARFERLEDMLPGAKPWLAALERDLGVPAGAATLQAFVNGSGSGLTAHCDAYEHFVIHLRGHKQFRVMQHPKARFPGVYHSARLSPAVSHFAQCPEGFPVWKTLPRAAETIDLRPGSVLFMPRGCYHSTRGGDAGEPALTVVIRIDAPTYADVLTAYLHDYLRQDERWRAPVVGGWSRRARERTAARRALRERLDELGEVVGTLSPAAMLRARDSLPAQIDAIDLDTRFQRDPSTLVEVREDAEADVVTVEVTRNLGEGERHALTLARIAAPALEWVARRRRPFSLRMLADGFEDWDVDSLAAILAFMTKERALCLLPFEAFHRPKVADEPPSA